MKKLTVQVTQEDIDNGERFKSRSCPISLSLKRQCNKGIIYVGATDFSIFKRKYFFSFWHTEFVYLLPETARTFVHRFDMALPVNPFVFELTLDHEK